MARLIFVETKRQSEAVAFYCFACDAVIEASAYWSIRTPAALHIHKQIIWLKLESDDEQRENQKVAAG